ncbi:MAG TPA: hypothetical protein DCX27_05170 [Balneola sp.]|nr:hypothetical protein [Balneola sp.]|tara:strand:- start:88 stop:453 length:366 start_codon:yes stop_codon:yes gene_type:complete
MKTNKISDVWVNLLEQDFDTVSCAEFMRLMRVRYAGDSNYIALDLFKTFQTSNNCSKLRRVGGIELQREVMINFMREEEKKKSFWQKIKPFVPKPTKIKTSSKQYKEGDKGFLGLRWTIRW